MDKNIKTELTTLKSELLSNLKNIESMVEKIDSQINEEVESACLKRCPNLDQFLKLCRTIKIDASMPSYDVVRFNSFVESFTERLELTKDEAMGKFFSDVIDSIKKLDDKLGPVYGGPPPIKTFDEIISERKAAQEEIVKEDVQKISESIPIVREILEQTSIEPEKLSIEIPSYLNGKTIDNSPISDIFKSVKEWDDVNQQFFVCSWNYHLDDRIKSLSEEFKIVLSDTARSTVPEFNIKSIEQANAFIKYNQLLIDRKNQINSLIFNFPNSCKEKLEAVQSDEKFVKFYSLLDQLLIDIRKIFNDDEKTLKFDERILSKNVFFRWYRNMVELYINLLQSAFDNHEKLCFRVTEATSALESVKLPTDVSEKFSNIAFQDYKKDLENAFKYYYSQKETPKS